MVCSRLKTIRVIEAPPSPKITDRAHLPALQMLLVATFVDLASSPLQPQYSRCLAIQFNGSAHTITPLLL